MKFKVSDFFQKENGEYIFVNGDKCFEKTPLKHNDRIIFGTNTIFVLKNYAKEDSTAPSTP